MSLWQLYLLSILPGIGIFCGAIFWMGGGLLTVATIAVTVNSTVEEDGIPKKFSLLLKRLWIVIAITGIITNLVPSEKQLYLIASSYVATNTKDVGKLPDNIVKAANSWLERIAKEADTDAKEKTKE